MLFPCPRHSFWKKTSLKVLPKQCLGGMPNGEWIKIKSLLISIILKATRLGKRAKLATRSSFTDNNYSKLKGGEKYGGND